MVEFLGDDMKNLKINIANYKQYPSIELMLNGEKIFPIKKGKYLEYSYNVNNKKEVLIEIKSLQEGIKLSWWEVLFDAIGILGSVVPDRVKSKIIKYKAKISFEHDMEINYMLLNNSVGEQCLECDKNEIEIICNEYVESPKVNAYNKKRKTIIIVLCVIILAIVGLIIGLGHGGIIK